MTFFDAIIQGIVQGLTEFLPVSSSGHLSITQHILGTTENNLFFNVMLHVGTLVAVVAFYHKLFLSLIKEFFVLVKDVFTRKFKWSEMNYERNLIMMLIIGLVPLFFLFVPIPGTDMKIKDLADVFTADSYLIVTAICLIVTSVLLSIGIFCNKRNIENGKKQKHSKDKNGKESFTVLDAVAVGCMQFVAAIFPGISRSGSTLSVGEMRGINKQKALDYTFVLGTPAIIAAALLEGIDALTSPEGISINPLVVITGMVVSAVVGYLAIVIFKWFLKTDKMFIFVIYTAIVGVIFLVISCIELNTGVNLFTGVELH
ncbi:MAG: undecaprenyl-diphosphate phosphatase [Ruminococcus sp.]|nr:undecaprenyl-diphosphate phosphatase [Ruminococcus sp.]